MILTKGTKILFICFLLLLFCSFFVMGAIINLPTCSFDNVKNAIDNANYGDTILVPSGICIWTNMLEIKKGVVLQGQGIDKTTIIYNGSVDYYSAYTIKFSADQTTSQNDYPFVISGFTFKQISLPYAFLSLSNENVSKALTKVLIYNNKFVGNGTGRGLVHYPGVFGVVYNNSFENVNSAWRFLGGDYGWTKVEEWMPGTGNALYFEDNYLYLTDKYDSSLVVSGGGGNRYVARYNTFNLSVREPFTGSIVSFDIHGNQENNPTAGIGLEIYGNLRIGTRGRWIDHRGGRVFFFYNRWLSTDNVYKGDICIWEEFNDDDFEAVPCPEGSSYGRTAKGNCIQRPHGSYYWRNFGGMNGTLLSNQLNILFDHYNRSSGTLNNPLTLFENDGWFRDNNIAFDGSIDPIGSCGYYGGPSCNKSSIGCGTFEDMMKITPKAAGLGFWVTNQSCNDIKDMAGFYHSKNIDGILYISKDNGKGGFEWKMHYKPYIYPHPLRVAPFGAKICGEGPIVSECWCQGMKSSGYCCYGYYQMNECGGVIQQISGDINSDGLVNIFDLVAIGIDFGKRSGLIHAKSDTNNDGIVDIFDVVYVAIRFM